MRAFLGDKRFECRICGETDPLEWEYEAKGACATCVCKLADAYLRAHSDERYPEFYSLEEWDNIVAEEKAKRAGRYEKKPVPQGLRMKVFERDGFKCVTCSAQADLQADHIHPERHGGVTTLENLQTLCRSCNSRKGARL